MARRYGRTPVLRGVDLALAAGESVLLLGRNGAGKSTLLRILAGLARPDQGTVELAGLTLTAAPAAWRRRVGFAGHRSMLYGELTPRENLRFAARLFGLRPADADAALERFDLGPVADRPVGALSRGLIQRTTLARALLHAPSLLLLDEPFTGLDVPSADTLAGLLRERAAAGVAIVLVTHQVEEAWPAVTRVAVLHGGTVALDIPRPATPAMTLERYREVTRG